MKIYTKLLLGLTTIGAACATGVIVSQTLNQQHGELISVKESSVVAKEEKPNVLENKQEISTGLSKKVNFSLTKFDFLEESVLEVVESKEQFTLNLNSVYERGSVCFLENGELVSSVTKQEGDKVTLKIDANEAYTVKEIQVYSATSNLRLEVVKEQEGIYSFQIPSKKISTEEGEMENPFFEEGKGINIEVVFGLSNIGSWVFNYDKNGFGTYTISLEEDLLLTDKNEKISLSSLKVEDSEFVRFKIEMNGHNVVVEEFTIPSQCSLILSNKTATRVEVSGLTEESRLVCNGSIVQDDLNIFNKDLKDQYGSKYIFVN